MGKSIKPFLVFNQLDIFTYQVRLDSKLCFDFSLPADNGEEVVVKVASEEVGQNEVKRDEDYGINDQSDKEEENEDEGQCEEAGDESAEDFVANEEEPALAGEVQGEHEDKLAGEEEMASSVPFLHLQRSSCLATFAFVEPTGAATGRGGEQVNNIN